MKTLSRALLLISMISLVAMSGCKQEGEAGAGSSSTESKTTKKETKKDGESASSSEKSDSGKDDANQVKLVDVPANVVKQIMVPYEDVTLTTLQKEQVDRVIKSNGAAFQTIRKQRSALLDADLRAKWKAAREAATASGADMAKAEEAALGTEIYTQISRLAKEQNDLIVSTRQSVQALLTKEQIKLLNAARKAKQK